MQGLPRMINYLRDILLVHFLVLHKIGKDASCNLPYRMDVHMFWVPSSDTRRQYGRG
ncbi:hypothetical protein NMG60_11020112 [Bertholletia excelsa]